MKNRMIVFGVVFFAIIFIFTGQKITKCFAQDNEEVNLQIITEDFAPYNFRSEDGEITGRSTDVVEEILSRLSLNIEIQLMNWNKAYAMALSKPDVILYSTFRTDDRENLFQWVGPIATDEMLFYALQGSDIVIDSLEDVKEVAAIGVVKDDARHQLLVRNNIMNLKLYPTDMQCYRALATGEVELVLGSNATMAMMAGQAGVAASELKPVYSVKKTPLYIAFSKNISPDIVEEWQSTLNEMIQDGTLDTINQSWTVTAIQDSTQ